MENTLDNEKVVLVVDDLFENLMILKRMLEKCGYMPMTAASASDALEMIKIKVPKLILLDVYMPEMDGFEFCEVLKKDVNTKDIPVIFISAGMSKEDKVKGFEIGGVDFINKPFALEEVSLRVSNHIHMYEMQKNMEAYNKRLNKMVKDHVMKIKEEQRNTIISLERLFFLHFPEREKHYRNIARNCRFLAQALEFSEFFEARINQSFIESIEEAVLLHDIGRIAKEPDNTSEEIGHEIKGANFLQELTFLSEQNELLKIAIDGAKCHNEHWNGTGKPGGLAGENIPIVARILSICVDFEDMLMDIYEKYNGISEDEAKLKAAEMMNVYAGKIYDPEIIKIFSQICKQFTIST